VSLIVDSSIWIDSFNSKIKTPEKESLKELIQNDYPIYLCPIIYQEVLQGIRDDTTFEQVKYIMKINRLFNCIICNNYRYAFVT